MRKEYEEYRKRRFQRWYDGLSRSDKYLVADCIKTLENYSEYAKELERKRLDKLSKRKQEIEEVIQFIDN